MRIGYLALAPWTADAHVGKTSIRASQSVTAHNCACATTGVPRYSAPPLHKGRRVNYLPLCAHRHSPRYTATLAISRAHATKDGPAACALSAFRARLFLASSTRLCVYRYLLLNASIVDASARFVFRDGVHIIKHSATARCCGAFRAATRWHFACLRLCARALRLRLEHRTPACLPRYLAARILPAAQRCTTTFHFALRCRLLSLAGLGMAPAVAH